MPPGSRRTLSNMTRQKLNRPSKSPGCGKRGGTRDQRHPQGDGWAATSAAAATKATPSPATFDHEQREADTERAQNTTVVLLWAPETMPPTHLAEDIQRVVADGPRGVVSVYLFGSHPAGRPHRESDVDLGVLLDRRVYATARERAEAALQLSALVARAARVARVDVIVLNDAPPLFARRIVSEGGRVACSDVELDRAFVRAVRSRAADLAPFLRRMARLKLEAIGRV